MRIYLASRFALQAEMRRYREQLRALGQEVTSRWLDETPDVARSLADDRRHAEDDLRDIYRSDTLIAFTEAESIGYTSGGRHVEFGYWLCLNRSVPTVRRRTIIVGPRENIFHAVAVVEHYATWEGAIESIKSTRNRTIVAG